MRYGAVWFVIGTMDIVGAISVVLGIIQGGMGGMGLVAGGATMIVGATLGFFTGSRFIGFTLGTVVGCAVGFLIIGGEEWIMGTTTGGIVGSLIGLFTVGLVGQWADRKKKEIDTSIKRMTSKIDEIRSQILDLKSIMLSMVEKLGVHSKVGVSYKQELNSLLDEMDMLQYNKNMISSLENAVDSYSTIKSDLNKTVNQLKHRYFGSSFDFIEKKSQTKKKKATKETPETKENDIRSPRTLDIKKTNENDILIPRSQDKKKKKETRIKPSDSYSKFLVHSKPRPAPESIKKLFPNLKITHHIGSGKFADVYKGTSPDGQPIAIKIPQIEIWKSLDPTAPKKLARDMNTWKDVKNEHIVKVYGHDKDPVPFFMMELMEGGDLDGLMTSHELTVEESTHIMLQVLEGMSFVHEKAIVHRDLKPGSVLFTNEGKAKVMGGEIGKTLRGSKSKKGDKEGPLSYLAPEQISPHKYGKVDWRSDVFQLGTMFYQMLTGTNPFEGDNMISIIGNILAIRPKTPSELNPDIPPELDELVMRSLEKRKENRWKNAEAMYNYLKEMIRSEDKAKTTV